MSAARLERPLPRTVLRHHVVRPNVVCDSKEGNADSVAESEGFSERADGIKRIRVVAHKSTQLSLSY